MTTSENVFTFTRSFFSLSFPGESFQLVPVAVRMKAKEEEGRVCEKHFGGPKKFDDGELKRVAPLAKTGDGAHGIHKPTFTF